MKMGFHMTIDGPDGTGKSTLADNIVKAMKNIFPTKRVVKYREPDREHPAIKQAIEIYLNALKFEEGSTVRKDLMLQSGLLFTIGRIGIRREVQREMDCGAIIVQDRSDLSTYIYQGEILHHGDVMRALVGANESFRIPDFALLVYDSGDVNKDWMDYRGEKDELDKVVNGVRINDAMCRVYSFLSNSRQIEHMNAEDGQDRMLRRAMDLVGENKRFKEMIARDAVDRCMDDIFSSGVI